MATNKSLLKRLFFLSLTLIISCYAPLLAQDIKKPEDNRFTKVVLAQKLEEPIQFDILPDGRVLYAERKGKLKVYEPAKKTVKLVAEIAVSTKYVSKTGEITEGEDGLQGVILDPDYANNNWIYLYYSPKDGDPKNILVRYEWKGDKLIESSKKVLLEVVVQREECCHVGGGMLFDKSGNLYLTTGDNTFSRASDGFTPIDERPGESPRDAQKSSGNTNDLRGKILRIHPEKDGSYTIPPGNLFPPGTALTRPEIYTMGNRNPWRMTIDSKTGWLYWGEVGPDGSVDSASRGPMAYDEFNLAKQAGNYGWPYFVADNKAYNDYDFATKRSGEKFNPVHPVNNSPNNKGLTDLPPATPAMIWYPYAASTEFPELQTGGRSATGGPIYHRSDFRNPSRPYPQYYEGKWFVTDWVRGWIMAVTLNDTGGYKSMEHFLPELKLRGPIDMKFGADGSLYVLEYGNGYFKDNPEAELIKIEYNAGNRKPEVQASADKTAGALPFKVNLSSAGTRDFDTGDTLKYRWTITKKGLPTRVFTTPNPTVTLTTAGEYKATLTVTDTSGAKNSKTVTLIAGNEPPKVAVHFNSGNRSFYFPGKRIAYEVKVNDREDGSLQNKKIPASQVAVTIDYLAEGFDLTEITQAQRSVDMSAQYAKAINMINKSDCKACHAIKTKSLGPSFSAVAGRYKKTEPIVTRLSKKIITGGSGVWGDAMMPAHSTLSENDARSIVNYILSVNEKAKTIKSRPVTGSYVTTLPADDKGKGSLIFRAAYTDRGSKSVPPQSGEHMLILRNPLIAVADMDTVSNVGYRGGRSAAVIGKSGAFIGLKNIDLNGIKQVELIGTGTQNPLTNVETELRAGSPDGKLVGSGKGGTIPITGETGMQDIYFVFRRADNDQGAPQIRAIRFRDE
jgi:cytochrome c